MRDPVNERRLYKEKVMQTYEHGVLSSLSIRTAIVAGILSASLSPSALRAQDTTSAAASDEISQLLAADGIFYATSLRGGSSSRGAVLRVTRSGETTVLHSFDDPTQGSAPTGVALGSDGSIFGTTSADGPNGYGTAFRITRRGQFSVLHAFTLADGGPVRAPLIRASDGHFYGTTAGDYQDVNPYFIALSNGSVFRLSVTGELTVLHSFTGGRGGDGAQARGLIQARDGDLYGVTTILREEASGKPDNVNWGTVFRISLAGTFTNLHTFSGPDGAGPVGQLLERSDGVFYGTTIGSVISGGFGNRGGNVFKITSAGDFTVLHQFSDFASEGAGPRVGVLPGDDGKFYGTTSSEGSDTEPGAGTFYRIDDAGALSTLHQFDIADGPGPGLGWARGSDGRFYGARGATFFRIDERGRYKRLGR